MTTATLNSLSRASSAYLRSAMHQPIRWHEWRPEAFATAQRENKPMLLDIGAVWCHWCHVMDRESYDDPEIAAIVNEHFIAVKVDRDERPDIDSRYQAAVQAVSGQGGWPLTAFLTPDGKPFYGGTYFPPQDHYGRPSFRRVLLSIAHAYKEKHGDVVEQASMVENAIVQAESFHGRSGRVSANVIQAIQESAFKMFDPMHGGFGSAPKFPHPSALDLLIERYARVASLRRADESVRPYTNHAEFRPAGQPGAAVPAKDHSDLHNLIVTTLTHMANGGVYDQLAGGFHRYSVDERWVVPHFEKMSYDNSELLKNYIHAYRATGEEFFADVARDIIRWMDEWLSDRERGGFYASQDADINMDDDGDYFTWTRDEMQAVLTDEEAQIASLRYDINEIGEMHHNPAKNVLYVRASIDEIAKRMKLSPEQVERHLESAKKKMYAARLQRPTPFVDKTVYVAWNSLCISAYLDAARVLDLPDPRRFALRSLDRLLNRAWKKAGDNGRASLLHVIAYSDPNANHREIPGLLDDYAFTAIACLDAYEASSDLSYFKFAQAIADAMIERFFDSTSGGFFDSEPGADEANLGVLATRRKPLQDSPTPAGNPMAAIALVRLHHYTGDAAYRDKAEQTLETFAGVAEQFGIFAATYGIAVLHLLESLTQVVVVAGEDGSSGSLEKAALAEFSFSKSCLRFAANQVVPANLPPILAATLPSLPQLTSGKSFAVLCSGNSCQPPVFEAGELQEALQTALRKG